MGALKREGEAGTPLQTMHVWAGAPNCYLDMLDKIQKLAFENILATSPETLTQH